VLWLGLPLTPQWPGAVLAAAGALAMVAAALRA
jgi:hypothetical protein